MNMETKIQTSPAENVRSIRLVTFVGLAWSLLLSVLKFTAGILSSSQALVADAVHSLSDLATDAAVVVGVKYWSAPPDQSHPYGHAKIETMITAAIGLALGGVGVSIIWEALSSLMEKHAARPGLAAFCVALISVVSKEILYRWTVSRARGISSSALEANAWHHRSDAISSVPVVAAIAVSFFFPSLDYVDRIGALIVSVFILHSSWTIVRGALSGLSDAVDGETLEKIRGIAASVPGALSLHAVRARAMGSTLQADLHLEVDPAITVEEGHAISHRVKRALLDSPLNISDAVVHLEPGRRGENCAASSAASSLLGTAFSFSPASSSADGGNGSQEDDDDARKAKRKSPETA